MISEPDSAHRDGVKHGQPRSMASFCIKCNRLFCPHMGARYLDDRFHELVRYEPVETFAGNEARLRVLAILEPRYAALDERSKTEFRFSEVELQHRDALAGTISTLHAMAPAGDLLPSRGSERFDSVVT